MPKEKNKRSRALERQSREDKDEVLKALENLTEQDNDGIREVGKATMEFAFSSTELYNPDAFPPEGSRVLYTEAVFYPREKKQSSGEVS